MDSRSSSSTLSLDSTVVQPLLSPVVSEPGHTESVLGTRDLNEVLLASLSHIKLTTSSKSVLKPDNGSSTRRHYSDNPNEPESESVAHVFRHGQRRQSITESITDSIIQMKDVALKELKRDRFIIIGVFSIICIVVFNLVFFPRSSLNRDLRRLHGQKLTYDDCSRVFLSSLGYNNTVGHYMNHYMSENHSSGENHELMESHFRHFGNYKVSKEVYKVWKREGTKLNVNFTGIKLDPHMIPYSANGTITTRYIYANYGSQEDYDLLKRHSINVKNHILIIRQNEIHSSLKVQLAQEHGAAAVLMYNDPYDDSKFTVTHGYKEFPDGFARNSNATNLFSSNFVYSQPGDPTTPGWSSTTFSKREIPKTIPAIPVLALNLNDSVKLLQNLKGPEIGWKGDLEFNYTPGPSEEVVDIELEVDESIKPINNIIATIPGVIYNEEIIIGASRDTINGEGGASNGIGTLMELSRGLNELLKLGWRPLRTIKLIAWDGGSDGLLGSTEFAEYYQSIIAHKTIAYINLSGVKGTHLQIESNPLFNSLLRETMNEVLIGESHNSTLYEYFKKYGSFSGINGIGDFSLFQSYIGTPSINIGFSNNANTDPVHYVSDALDSIEWVQAFDKELQLPNILAQLVGKFVINLSEGELLQLKVSDYFEYMATEFDLFKREIPDGWTKQQIKSLNTEVEELLTTLEKTLKNSQVQAANFDANLVSLQESLTKDYPWYKLFNKIKTANAIKKNNLQLKSVDKIFVDKHETSKQPHWVSHLVFGPNINGANVPFPSLHNAIYAKDYSDFEKGLLAFRQSLNKVLFRL